MVEAPRPRYAESTARMPRRLFGRSTGHDRPNGECNRRNVSIQWPLPCLTRSGLFEGIVGNRLYVGNLPYSSTDESLREAFSPHGEVTSASVVLDRVTGRSRGFGFVEMATSEAAEKAT